MKKPLFLILKKQLANRLHLREHPRDLAILPVLTLTVILVALPIKLYAFLTMNRQGWLTRAADRVGGEAQTATSLSFDADQAAHVGDAGAAAPPPVLVAQRRRLIQQPVEQQQ